MMVATIKVKGETDLQNILKQRSLGGGAWVASVMPFTHEVRLHQFPTPSAVPDEFMADTFSQERGIAWKGELVPYSNAALAREQRRGYNADR